jgi:hypothetical protein|nr:MAG TPA: hypothetical protein [Caudoviricetes sp.]
MAETWVLNTSVTFSSSVDTEINFTSNGTAFVYFRVGLPEVYYCTSTNPFSGYVTVYNRNSGWVNEAYRTVVFDTAPTGNLLIWLQANGTKQVDPEPTTPKHACLIDGTGYSIKRGKVSIGGTGYDIKNGKALVDGTAYDIPFTPKSYVVTVTLSSYTHVIYNDTLYSYDTVLYVAPGDSVRCVVSAALRYGMTDVAVRVNGTKVKTSSFAGPPPHNLPQYSYYYDFTPESDATITGTTVGGGNSSHGEIDITT